MTPSHLRGLTALAALVLGCAPSPTATAVAIVGGGPDVSHDAVVFVRSSRGSCSGALIDAQPDGTGLILTAGHCVVGTDFRVSIGDDHASSDTIWLPVVETFVHPGYEGYGQDLALLRVSGVPEGAQTLSPLTATEDHLTPGAGYQVLGYGVRDSSGTRTTQRHAAAVTVTSVDPSQLFSDWGDGIVCFGDSGGPMLRTVDGSERLVGVNVGVNSERCDMASHMSSTRVAAYEDFIESVVLGRPPGCTTCLQTNAVDCWGTVCSRDENCSAYNDCVRSCLDLNAPCTNACVRRYPEGATLYASSIGGCYCGAPCGAVCDAACAGPLLGLASPEPDAGVPPTPDASLTDRDASASRDASAADDAAAADAGMDPTPSGCGCRAAHTSTHTSGLLAGLLGVWLWARRTRSR